MVEISDAVDVHAVVGAVVVFTIIGAAVFGVYYFGFARPAAAELEQTKTAALSNMSQTLGSVGTEQALTAISSFNTQIQAAVSKSEVSSIQAEAAAVYQRELKRKSLLDKVTTAVTGFYHSTADVPALATLATTLRADINAKTTLTDLQNYELSGTIDTQATSTWRAFFTSLLGNLGENLAMYRNSPISGGYISKENALAIIAAETWETLRKLKFENKHTVEVPVLDTFQRAPTIKPNSIVNIYVYDIATDNMSELWANVKVRNVIYSQADIAAIAWALTDGATTQSYSVNMWETIKAVAAGDPEAAAVGWSAYGSDLMDRALTANIGSYTVSVIYMVEVPNEIGMKIAQYELHMTATKDIILIATV